MLLNKLIGHFDACFDVKIFLNLNDFFKHFFSFNFYIVTKQ